MFFFSVFSEREVILTYRVDIFFGKSKKTKPFLVGAFQYFRVRVNQKIGL